MWRETGIKIGRVTHLRNFNPLPPCGGRLNVLDAIVFAILISIHSLRVEGDVPLNAGVILLAISIHSLRVEGDA